LTKIRLQRARKVGYDTVYLDTVNAKLYHLKYGWEVVKEIIYKGELDTIMKLKI